MISAERDRQLAFNKAVSRILKARAGVRADIIAKSPANRIVERLAGHLNAVWQDCRTGKSGAVEFAGALRDWEEESILHIQELEQWHE